MKYYYQNKITKLIYMVTGMTDSNKRTKTDGAFLSLIKLKVDNIFVTWKKLGKRFNEVKLICRLKKK